MLSVKSHNVLIYPRDTDKKKVQGVRKYRVSTKNRWIYVNMIFFYFRCLEMFMFLFKVIVQKHLILFISVNSKYQQRS